MQTPQPTRMLWQQDEDLRDLEQRLAAGPVGTRVVSFDFFDTLFSRLCAEPSDLFIEAGRRLAQQNQLLIPLSPVEFRAARIAADERAREKSSRAGRSSEVKLAEIYAELKMVVRDPAAACRLEFELERLFCYLNPAMASLVEYVRSLGFRTAILSDTYFTAAQLTKLLDDAGLPASLFDVVMVSSERGKAKWNGHLYHDLFRHFDIHASELLHIGDNKHSDITMARHLGASAVQYHRTTAAQDAMFKSERALRGTNLHTASALDSLRVLTSKLAQSEQDPFRDGTMVFGPVLSKYADWAVQRFAAAGVKKVLALMREGELLGELLAHAANAAGVQLEVIPCFVSRIATARASMSELNPAQAFALLEGSANLTPLAVLEILGLGEEAKRALGPELCSKPLSSIESVHGFLRLLFQIPELRRQIELRHKESFELAYEYLSHLAGNESTLGILDLGWSGSIQKNVARILRRGGKAVRTVGCYLACTRRSGRLALEGDTAHAYMDQDWDRSAILPEVAITACVGSTDGYKRNAAGKVVPVLGPFEISPEERVVKQRLRDGILAFQSLWLALGSIKGRANFSAAMLDDMDRNAASILYRLMDFPTKSEADRLGRLRHDENYFGKNHSAALCDEVSPARLHQDGVQSLFHNSKCYWPQGVVARENPRLVAALRSGWTDPLTLGRLGVTHGVTPVNGGTTDEELASLGGLLSGFKPEQVVFVGRFTPAVEELFSFLWKRDPRHTAGETRNAKLIVAGAADDFAPKPEFMTRFALVPGDLNDSATVRDIRKCLDNRGNMALVFAADHPQIVIDGVVNGLAPFLGAKGLIFGARGRFDRHAADENLPLLHTLAGWHQSLGEELGYLEWEAPAGAQSHLCNWTVYRRAVDELVWNQQWMATVGDLPPVFAPQTDSAVDELEAVAK